MLDDLGIVYLIQNAQQFWSELEDVLDISKDNSTTLSSLDLALHQYVSLCAGYHEQFLQSPFQLHHACDLLLDSELFTFHSERMCENLIDDALHTTDPHTQYVIYSILLFRGRRLPAFFRSTKRWSPLFPRLIDHVLVEMDPDVEDTYVGGGSAGAPAVPIPIEAKLRSLGVKLLYEVSRFQKLTLVDLRVFDDAFLNYLFDLVEQTRVMQDDTFNYSVIKLLVALNEHFMAASLNSFSTTHPPPSNGKRAHPPPPPADTAKQNRVFNVLMCRLWNTRTFGENMIFMLNRASHSPDDLCMQLLVLKFLYLLFTNSGTSEYFYTNDLCVLVDVILREVVDLDEDSESLRHTYLRVLHPLLTKTQFRTLSYKRAQIVLALESLISDEHGIRNVNPTTKRLAERVLNGDWCVLLMRRRPSRSEGEPPPPQHQQSERKGSDSTTASSESSESHLVLPGGSASQVIVERKSSTKGIKTLKMSRSFVNLPSIVASSSSATSSPNSGGSSAKTGLRSTFDDVLRTSANHNGSLVAMNEDVLLHPRPPRPPRDSRNDISLSVERHHTSSTLKPPEAEVPSHPSSPLYTPTDSPPDAITPTRADSPKNEEGRKILVGRMTQSGRRPSAPPPPPPRRRKPKAHGAAVTVVQNGS